MIVREHLNHFVMIEQNNHAHISGEIISNWKDSLFYGAQLKESVKHAIYKHDYGWKMIDKQPFWNDKKQEPYSFVDFPNPPKTVFYKHGIDEVEKEDPYAGLLCSQHYTRFLLNDPSKEAQAFIQAEKDRQHQIINSLSGFDNHLFDFHYGLLQFCDNLSLYICLNKPGEAKENEHPFFRGGIPASKLLDTFEEDKIHLHWKDKNSIQLGEFPFKDLTTITLKQKTISKVAISTDGLMESYQNAPFMKIEIRLEPE